MEYAKGTFGSERYLEVQKAFEDESIKEIHLFGIVRSGKDVIGHSLFSNYMDTHEHKIFAVVGVDFEHCLNTNIFNEFGLKNLLNVKKDTQVDNIYKFLDSSNIIKTIFVISAKDKWEKYKGYSFAGVYINEYNIVNKINPKLVQTLKEQTFPYGKMVYTYNPNRYEKFIEFNLDDNLSLTKTQKEDILKITKGEYNK